LKRRFFSDAAWIVAGQIATALATVLGIRLLTELVSPTIFGSVSLVLGAAALALNVGCVPLNQAALYFYPSMESRNAVGLLREAQVRALGAASLAMLLVVALGGALFVGFGFSTPTLVVLLALLLACDCWRATEVTFLNAARRHRRYAIWVAGDALLRPLAAAAAVIIMGGSSAAVLSGYVLGSGVMIAMLSARHAFGMATDTRDPRSDESRVLRQEMWQYALPLIPFGLVGWTSGLGDRYIIGGLLSLADAGIYVAAYGLASRPFLMLGQSIELLVRPVYQAALLETPADRANRLVARWLAAVGTIGSLGVVVVAVWRVELAELLLGEQFRAGADLMPWIAAGYWLLGMSQVFERICYAHGRTGWVLAIQLAAAVVGIAATAVGALDWGLIGAAVAVPVCFGVKLVVSILAALHTHTNAKRAMPVQHAVN
jgi:O-antigen/teichoic acid export membrane protein